MRPRLEACFKFGFMPSWLETTFGVAGTPNRCLDCDALLNSFLEAGREVTSRIRSDLDASPILSGVCLAREGRKTVFARSGKTVSWSERVPIACKPVEFPHPTLENHDARTLKLPSRLYGISHIVGFCPRPQRPSDGPHKPGTESPCEASTRKVSARPWTPSRVPEFTRDCQNSLGAASGGHVPASGAPPVGLVIPPSALGNPVGFDLRGPRRPPPFLETRP